MTVKILAFFVVAAWVGAAVAAVPGEEGAKMGQGIVLPGEVEGWKWDGVEVKHDNKTLFDYIDGAAEMYLAYGFQTLNARRFEKTNHPPLTVEVYEMGSSEDAFGVFSFDRQDEPAGIGQGSEFGGGLLRFWKGKYFVSVYSDGGGPDVEPVILKIGKLTAGLISAQGPEPQLLRLIPGRDFRLVERSVCFLRSHVLLNQRFFIAHQNILNLNSKTEAVSAQYQGTRGKVQLLLLRYPGLRESEEAYRSFQKIYLQAPSDRDRSKTEDQRWTVAWQRKEFLLVVFGAAAEAEAEGLLRATEAKLAGR